jgi:hypothetical protein
MRDEPICQLRYRPSAVLPDPSTPSVATKNRHHACGQRRRRWRSDTAASRWLNEPPGCRVRRSRAHAGDRGGRERRSAAGTDAAAGGWPEATEKDRTLLEDLDALVEPMTRGDPHSPLRWTSKGTWSGGRETKDLTPAYEAAR